MAHISIYSDYDNQRYRFVVCIVECQTKARSLRQNYSPTPSQQRYHEEIRRMEKDEDLQILDNLKDWPKNWDGFNAEKPKVSAIVHAQEFLKELFLLKVDLQEQWISPNITASSEGEVVFEWWNKQKKITLYVSSFSISYIKVPSASIEDMEDGSFKRLNAEVYINLFSWLEE